MQVGGNGVRQETLFYARNALAEIKTTSSMTDVENDAALAGLE
jgi:hypothetical protein